MHSSPGGSPSAGRTGPTKRPATGRGSSTDSSAAPSPALSPACTRVLFLDAEGTLWTERPGRTMDEFWQRPTRGRAREVFRLAPGLRDLLRGLKASGCLLVVLSRHDERVLPEILEEFHLSDLFDDVLINGDKGERAAAWLEDHAIDREEAVMVGDREDLDIRPMRRVGIRSLLIDRPYNADVEAERIFALQELPGRLATPSPLPGPPQVALPRPPLDHGNSYNP